MDLQVPAHRALCLRCRRPKSVCWCGDVTEVPSRTHVIFLQHPREARVPISTCRMAHLSLPNSELHIGLGAVGNPALEAACARPSTAVLFPSESATDVDALAAPPETLVVVDGTWSNAKKVVEKCPLLSRLPRLKFFPARPGNYRIRREPDAHCLSTIEATAFVLERLERAPGRFTAILSAFDAMVERQLEYVRANVAGSRHRNKKKRNSVRKDWLAPLRARFEQLVVVFGEANAWPVDDPNRPLPDEPELVQLVAERLSTGERFEQVLRPARPLGPRVPQHLDLPAERILSAPERSVVLDVWRAFVKPDELLVGWGRFCRDLLCREGVAPAEFVDFRATLAQHRNAPPGPVEQLAAIQGLELPEGQGRAARRLAALAAAARAELRSMS
jgi:DTW domain-containing protein YfiP